MPDKEEIRDAVQMFLETAGFLEVQQDAFDKVTEYDIEYRVLSRPGSSDGPWDADDLDHAKEIVALDPSRKIQSRMVYLASWEDEK